MGEGMRDRSAAYLTPVPEDAVVYGSGESAVIVSKVHLLARLSMSLWCLSSPACLGSWLAYPSCSLRTKPNRCIHEEITQPTSFRLSLYWSQTMQWSHNLCIHHGDSVSSLFRHICDNVCLYNLVAPFMESAHDSVLMTAAAQQLLRRIHSLSVVIVPKHARILARWSKPVQEEASKLYSRGMQDYSDMKQQMLSINMALVGAGCGISALIGTIDS